MSGQLFRAAAPTLAAEGIAKRFGGTVALCGVDLELHPGEVHALVGENGSGKSTLLKVLSGIHRPDRGVVRLDGVEHAFHRPQDAVAAGVALVSQEGSLVPGLSVGENLFAGRLPRRRGMVDWAAVSRDAERLLAQVEFDVSPRTVVGSLAAGQRQVIEIARALSSNPRILILDEPTSSLDVHEVDVLLATMSRLKTQGIAIAFVTHRMPELFAISDRFTVLRDGEHIGTRTRAEGVDEDWLVRSMVGRELHEVQVGARTEPCLVPALEVCSLSDRSGRVQGASFTVEKGEVVGLAGLVGAGRTELLETIIGHRPRHTGEILVDGLVVGRGVRAALRAGLALVAEDRKAQALLPTRSVLENASLTLPVGRGLIRRIGREEKQAKPWLERLAVKCAGLEQPVAGLSGGNQQKVLIARAMVLSPKVLLLDEPTRGVDLGAKQRIYEEVIALAKSGIGVLIASSELPELLALCHRVLVIREGKVVDELQRDAMTEESIVGAATGAMVS